VSPDDGAEQFPGAASPVDAHHAQDLEESETTQRGRGEHLTTAETQNDDTRRDDDDICMPINQSHDLYCITAVLPYL